MEIFVLGSDEEYATYTTLLEESKIKFGFVKDRVSLPDEGEPPIAFVEGFGDANVLQKPMRRGDFHTAYSDIRLFSQQAVDSLGSALTSTGRLFPATIAGREEPFYWYWCTQVVDCIDESRTRRGPPSSLPIERRLIMTPAFRMDRIGDNEIFVVPGQSRQFDMFVTDSFRDKVARGRLKGFKLGQSRMDPRPWRS